MRLTLLLAVAVCGAADQMLVSGKKTLVSYVYYRPDKTFAQKTWEKCAFKDKLCGCETSIRSGSTGVGVATKERLTNCTAPVCWCSGSGGAVAKYKQCTDNLEYFLDKGVTPYLHDTDVDFLFNVVGDTEIPDRLNDMAQSNPQRVTVSRVPNAETDLCTQGNVVRKGKLMYERFFLINCSARGPYGPHMEKWLDKFERKMVQNSSVHLVGPVINCWQKQPHVQSWAWYADATAADLIAAGCTCDGSRNDQIRRCELQISAQLLAASGSTIASLQPSYSSIDWKSTSSKNCNRGKSPVGCSRTDPETSLACQGANLCEEVFAKYGGTNIPLGFTPYRTHKRIQDFEAGVTGC